MRSAGRREPWRGAAPARVPGAAAGGPRSGFPRLPLGPPSVLRSWPAPGASARPEEGRETLPQPPGGCYGVGSEGRRRCGARPRCSVGKAPQVFLFPQYRKGKHFSNARCERQGRVAAVPGALKVEKARWENPSGFPGWIRGRGKILLSAATETWARRNPGAAALQRSTPTPVRSPRIPCSRLSSPSGSCGQMQLFLQ